MPDTYGEGYYKTGNYTDYLERGPRYERMADELVSFLRSVGLLQPATRLTDFGCGVGLLASALQTHGCNVTGFDASPWASRQAAQRGVPMLDTYQPCDGLIALDVFEHMSDAGVSVALHTFQPHFLIVRIPVASAPGQPFHLSISRRDPTHINCKTAQEWQEFFSAAHYHTLLLNLHTIYNSTGVFCALLTRCSTPHP